MEFKAKLDIVNAFKNKTVLIFDFRKIHAYCLK